MGITIRITSADVVIRIEKNRLYGEGFEVLRIYGSSDILIQGSKDKFNRISYTWDESIDVERIEILSPCKVFIKEGALNPKLDFTAVIVGKSVLDIGNNRVETLYVYASGGATVENARVNFYLFSISDKDTLKNITNDNGSVGVKPGVFKSGEFGFQLDGMLHTVNV